LATTNKNKQTVASKAIVFLCPSLTTALPHYIILRIKGTDMLETKQQLAKAITRIFNSSAVKSELAAKINPSNVIEIKNAVANVLYFLVATRTPNISGKTVQALLNTKDVSAIIVNQIKQHLTEQGALVSNQAVLTVLKQNIFDHGIYMHSFPSLYTQNIMQQGLDPKLQLFESERAVLEGFLDYPYFYKANRNHVTGTYEIVYSYGAYSPEWVYNIVKDNEAMLQRDYGKAMQIMSDRLQDTELSDDAKSRILTCAQNVFAYYLKETDVHVALIDKYEKNAYGRRLFNRYNEESDRVQEADFNLETLAKRFDTSDTIFLEKATDYLLNKSRIYELSTIDTLQPHQFAIASIPGIPTLHKHKAQNKTQIASNQIAPKQTQDHTF